mmetsp:Transcript_18516/g.56889  ORF Transcript_18516/g.56889 Transcript_18516/m.56889 type:complete len:225 (+) Transcript_18516:783-1457(+)
MKEGRKEGRRSGRLALRKETCQEREEEEWSRRSSLRGGKNASGPRGFGVGEEVEAVGLAALEGAEAVLGALVAPGAERGGVASLGLVAGSGGSLDAELDEVVGGLRRRRDLQSIKRSLFCDECRREFAPQLLARGLDLGADDLEPEGLDAELLGRESLAALLFAVGVVVFGDGRVAASFLEDLGAERGGAFGAAGLGGFPVAAEREARGVVGGVVAELDAALRR